MIQTRDGKRHQGELTFTNDAVQVSNAAEVACIPRADIARLSFDPESIAPASDSKGQGIGLLGYYFANTNVLGPVHVRIDPLIDLDWGTAEPIADVGHNYFTVIWMGHLEAPASGEFTFSLTADDDARLQIGADLVVESHKEESTGQLVLEKGERYPITLLYRDNIGGAKIRLAWSGPDFAKTAIPSDRWYPASFVTEHQADIQSHRGLLATAYDGQDFTGPTSSRVDTSVDASTAGTTRWTGQLRADYSEPYTFYIATDGPVRLRLNGKPIIDKWMHHGLGELKATARLPADELHDLQLESLGSGERRLLWSSPSQPKAVISEVHLVPFKRAVEPVGPNHLLPAGVLLRNGSFIACRVESLEDDVFQCTRLLEGKKIPAPEMARIVCQPLPRTLAARVTPGRRGVLLANGDFVEGQFAGMEGNRVTVNSVLFGLRTYDTSRQVLAVILRECEGAALPCEIQLRDQSILFAAAVDLQSGNVVLKDKLLANLSVPEGEIQALKLR